MFGQCFFCGKPANTERGDICSLHERKLLSPYATGLRTRKGQGYMNPVAPQHR